MSLAGATAMALVAACDRPVAGQGDGDAAAPRPRLLEPLSTIPDPEALAEIVAAAPHSDLQPTAPDGGTLIGSYTDADAGTDPQQAEPMIVTLAHPPSSGPSLELGPATTLRLSSPAIERAAREQIYWHLVQECRGPEGEILPPDAIVLEFVIRPDGAIDPGSIHASAQRPEHAAAAECVQRRFVSLPFRAPAAAGSGQTPVRATLPSVD